MDRKAIGSSLLVALLLGITVNAPAGELAEAQALFDIPLPEGRRFLRPGACDGTIRTHQERLYTNPLPEGLRSKLHSKGSGWRGQQLLHLTESETVGPDGPTSLYKKHCSLCHGLIGPDTAQPFDRPAPHRHMQTVIERPPAITLTVASRRKMHGLSTSTAPFIASLTSEEHLAFAPPYGPPLRGVYGRLAGSVTGFPYSRAFKETLQGVVWTRQRLDVWIADSQAWVPGSRMFYQQPDAEIRRKIITYLEANR